MGILKKSGLTLLFLLILGSKAVSQCAMCRISLENNVSSGQIGVAENLNLGILYLLSMPYLAAALVAILWYKKSKANEQFSGSH